MRRVVGCMTGTSIDALDAALVEIGGAGLAMHARFVSGHTEPLGGLAPRLRRLAEQEPTTAGEVAALAHALSDLHVNAIGALLGANDCDLVCVHGQTVFHKPPLSWQLMQPAPIARALHAPVVYDLRQADLAAGGQGAPITPLADWVLFRRHADPATVINLGGFANYSQWFTDGPEGGPPPTAHGLDIRGGDICACNQLLDGLSRLRMDKPYDEDGAVARAGVLDDHAFRLFRDGLAAQGREGRSLGTGDELVRAAARLGSVATPALLRSACEAIADVIAERLALRQFGGAIVAGGGVRNQALLGALADRNRGALVTTGEAGVPPEYREAACFAVLGALCQDRVPITIPAVTRCKAPAPLSGAWVFP